MSQTEIILSELANIADAGLGAGGRSFGSSHLFIFQSATSTLWRPANDIFIRAITAATNTAITRNGLTATQLNAGSWDITGGAVIMFAINTGGIVLVLTGLNIRIPAGDTLTVSSSVAAQAHVMVYFDVVQ